MGFKDLSLDKEIFSELKKPPEKRAKAAEKMSEEELRAAADILQRIISTRTAISRTEKLAKLLDSRFVDPLIGIFGTAGDIIPALIGAYIVGEGLKLGMPTKDIIKMLANIGIDAGVGMIPVLGDIFDFFFKSNERNVEIIRRYLAKLEASLPAKFKQSIA